MPPIYEVAGQLYVVPDVHLNEVVKHDHEHRHDYGPIAWTHPHEHEHQQGDGEVHVHEHEAVKEDEDNGRCQGCDRDCDHCTCDCLLCEGFICIEPTMWAAIREAVDAVCFSNTPDHAATVRALLDEEEGE